VVEQLLCKCEALSSNPSPIRRRRRRRRRRTTTTTTTTTTTERSQEWHTSGRWGKSRKIASLR
jgi:hypothetical protein